MRVMGSHAISTRSSSAVPPVAGIGIVEVIALPLEVWRRYQVRVAPVSSCRPGLRQLGSWSSVCVVMFRSVRMVVP